VSTHTEQTTIAILSGAMPCLPPLLTASLPGVGVGVGVSLSPLSHVPHPLVQLMGAQ
jgi:hypothetical protein